MHHGHATYQAMSCWSLAVEACIQSQCHSRGWWRKRGTWIRFFLCVFNSLVTQLNAHYVTHQTGIWRVHNKGHTRLSATPISYCSQNHCVTSVPDVRHQRVNIPITTQQKTVYLSINLTSEDGTVSTQGHSNKRITYQFHTTYTFTIKTLYCTVRDMIQWRWLCTLLMPLFSAKCDSHLSVFTISPLHFYSRQPRSIHCHITIITVCHLYCLHHSQYCNWCIHVKCSQNCDSVQQMPFTCTQSTQRSYTSFAESKQ